MLKPSVQYRNRLRQGTRDRLPGQTLKRKKYIFASIVLICAGFDWCLLFLCEKALHPLLCDAPYLPAKYAQEYTHLKTCHIPDDYPIHQRDIKSIAFSTDNKRLTAVAGKIIHFWDVQTTEHLSALKTDPRWVGAAAFSPDGKTVASVSSRISTPPIYHLELRDILYLPSRKQEQVLPFDRKLFIDYTVEMWDVKTGKKRLTFPAETVLLKALEFSPDGRKLLLTTYSSFIEVYDPTTGEYLQRRISFLAQDVMLGTYAVNAFAFSPDGKIFASGGRDRVRRQGYVADAEIQLWNIDTGLPLQTLKSPGGRIQLLAFSPDSKILASTFSYDFRWCRGPPNEIYIWDVENRRPLSIINVGEVGERNIQTLRFAPNNIILASGHIGGRIHLWDITAQTNLKKQSTLGFNQSRFHIRE